MNDGEIRKDGFGEAPPLTDEQIDAAIGRVTSRKSDRPKKLAAGMAAAAAVLIAVMITQNIVGNSQADYAISKGADKPTGIIAGAADCPSLFDMEGRFIKKLCYQRKGDTTPKGANYYSAAGTKDLIGEIAKLESDGMAVGDGIGLFDADRQPVAFNPKDGPDFLAGSTMRELCPDGRFVLYESKTDNAINDVQVNSYDRKLKTNERVIYDDSLANEPVGKTSILEVNCFRNKGRLTAEVILGIIHESDKDKFEIKHISSVETNGRWTKESETSGSFDNPKVNKAAKKSGLILESGVPGLKRFGTTERMLGKGGSYYEPAMKYSLSRNVETGNSGIAGLNYVDTLQPSIDYASKQAVISYWDKNEDMQVGLLSNGRLTKIGNDLWRGVFYYGPLNAN